MFHLLRTALHLILIRVMFGERTFETLIFIGVTVGVLLLIGELVFIGVLAHNLFH